MPIAPDYLAEIRRRKAKSRIYKDFQLLGLELAELLRDEAHKSLYIKIAKTHDQKKIRRIAKEVSQKKNVKNKGAYFMKVLSGEK